MAEAVSNTTSADVCDSRDPLSIERYEDHAESAETFQLSAETNAAKNTSFKITDDTHIEYADSDAELTANDKSAEQQHSAAPDPEIIIGCAAGIIQQNLSATLLQKEGRPRVLFIFSLFKLPTKYALAQSTLDTRLFKLPPAYPNHPAHMPSIVFVTSVKKKL